MRAADDHRDIRVCARHPSAASRCPTRRQIGRFHLGFIRFTPSIALTNLGVDTNVFNELEDPKDDFTVTFGPKAEFWSRLGPRGRLYGSVGIDYQYFQEYDSQRVVWDRRRGRGWTSIWAG